MSLYFSGYESIFKKLNKGFFMSKYLTITLSDGKEVRLTKKQKDFARLYVTSGDATNSRLKAGYANNKSSNTVEGFRLLQELKIQDAVEYYRLKASKKIDISENRVLAELASMAMSNVTNLFDEDGQFKPLEDLDPFTQRAIKSIKTKRRYEGDDLVVLTDIELHPKLPALKLLAEIKGIAQVVDDKSNRPVNVNVNINGKQVDVNDN